MLFNVQEERRSHQSLLYGYCFVIITVSPEKKGSWYGLWLHKKIRYEILWLRHQQFLLRLSVSRFYLQRSDKKPSI